MLVLLTGIRCVFEVAPGYLCGHDLGEHEPLGALLMLCGPCDEDVHPFVWDQDDHDWPHASEVSDD